LGQRQGGREGRGEGGVPILTYIHKLDPVQQ
jgi:hypothetical protein